MTTIQKIIPILLGILISLGIWFFCRDMSINLNLNKFLELSITVFSILLGFLFTVTTILHSVKNDRMEFIKKSGGMASVNSSLRYVINYSLIVIFSTIFYFLLEEFLVCFSFVKYFLLVIHISAAIHCFLFVKIFFRIILQ